MQDPPHFSFPSDYRSSFAEFTIWRPLLEAVIKRHGLPISPKAPSRGIAGTFPTFLWGELVIKFFGHLPNATQSFEGEVAVYDGIKQIKGLLPPKMRAFGTLFEDSQAPWHYVVLSRIEGEMWFQADLSGPPKIALAAEIGRQVQLLHQNEECRDFLVGKIPQQSAYVDLDIIAANKRSLLPAHLIEEIPSYLAAHAEIDPVVAHGDLMERHVFIKEGILRGIIDWGDALIADRHYDLAKIHLGLFEGQPGLLAAFLEGANWPILPDFADRALAQSLRRQAILQYQHGGQGDVFHRIGQILPDPTNVKSLADLARLLFAH